MSASRIHRDASGRKPFESRGHVAWVKRRHTDGRRIGHLCDSSRVLPGERRDAARGDVVLGRGCLDSFQLGPLAGCGWWG